MTFGFVQSVSGYSGDGLKKFMCRPTKVNPLCLINSMSIADNATMQHATKTGKHGLLRCFFEPPVSKSPSKHDSTNSFTLG